MDRAIFPEISRRIASGIGKAVCTFRMIGQGDHITVGLSGGKDSSLLLLGLAWLKERSPVKYSLRATMVDITNGEFDTGPMSRLCESLDIPFEVIPCRVLEIIRKRNEKAPCSLCSKMRAGALFAKAVENGSTTVAFGHNLDDAVETVLLNLFYTGRFRCFHPKSWRDRTGLWLIRPLVFLSESEIAREVRRLGLELIPPLCPFPRDSKRDRIKNLVRTLEGEISDIRSQLLHALMSPGEENKWKS
ncbi:MAG: ATP-binding protein [Thermovirgaceae bacterium]